MVHLVNDGHVDASNEVLAFMCELDSLVIHCLRNLETRHQFSLAQLQDSALTPVTAAGLIALSCDKLRTFGETGAASGGTWVAQCVDIFTASLIIPGLNAIRTKSNAGNSRYHNDHSFDQGVGEGAGVSGLEEVQVHWAADMERLCTAPECTGSKGMDLTVRCLFTTLMLLFLHAVQGPGVQSPVGALPTNGKQAPLGHQFSAIYRSLLRWAVFGVIPLAELRPAEGVCVGVGEEEVKATNFPQAAESPNQAASTQPLWMSPAAVMAVSPQQRSGASSGKDRLTAQRAGERHFGLPPAPLSSCMSPDRGLAASSESPLGSPFAAMSEAEDLWPGTYTPPQTPQGSIVPPEPPCDGDDDQVPMVISPSNISALSELTSPHAILGGSGGAGDARGVPMPLSRSGVVRAEHGDWDGDGHGRRSGRALGTTPFRSPPTTTTMQDIIVDEILSQSMGSLSSPPPRRLGPSDTDATLGGGFVADVHGACSTGELFDSPIGQAAASGGGGRSTFVRPPRIDTGSGTKSHILKVSPLFSPPPTAPRSPEDDAPFGVARFDDVDPKAEAEATGATGTQRTPEQADGDHIIRSLDAEFGTDDGFAAREMEREQAVKLLRTNEVYSSHPITPPIHPAHCCRTKSLTCLPSRDHATLQWVVTVVLPASIHHHILFVCSLQSSLLLYRLAIGWRLAGRAVGDLRVLRWFAKRGIPCPRPPWPPAIAANLLLGLVHRGAIWRCHDQSCRERARRVRCRVIQCGEGQAAEGQQEAAFEGLSPGHVLRLWSVSC